ncbi:hypothetical protein M426DRAFT_17460 [Hypoxylon sp. CI-4A]|nr:hypothetical protein M426DRAFT_17460 [Hypoxylon sp. CI-4A]
MWDASANGYGRGEGIGALVMKRLVDAERDGDHVECIIRETALNQDGRTKGITMPSPDAQRRLIRDCYLRAGLDLRIHRDRPQFFEAHGTGTPAGDPVEAEAIRTSFFDDDLFSDDKQSVKPSPLLVGSIKTIIGHTEGTAGIAALMKTSLALQHSEITPNLHFNELNPRIRPYSADLIVPTSLRPWPAVEHGQPRRASVNSFGFGGTNAHAILESYLPDLPHKDTGARAFSPFVFSAASTQSLQAQMLTYARWLSVNEHEVDLRDLAYTLHSRRSHLPFSTFVAAETHQQLRESLMKMVDTANQDPSNSVGTRANRDLGSRKPTILGVFTGQGAQWARMGAKLIEISTTAQTIIQSLEDRLSLLPEPDRPSWSLREELLKDAKNSRVKDATFSHPLCAAIQIILVDVLRAAGIEFDAVVGHSSGEVGAAYAAGLISAEDAICIAYYRGLHSGLASGIQYQPGAMLAVETTFEDALDICESPDFQGRVSIAAHNSSTSVTIAGDKDAIEELKDIFDDEKKFSRMLRVDKAYHSHHMTRCSQEYLTSLRQLNIQVCRPQTCRWFSSTYEDDVATQEREGSADVLKHIYWAENMVRPVLFMQALERAQKVSGHFDLAIEVGPHPALQGPALQTLQQASNRGVTPYTGLLRRGDGDIESVAGGLGYAWVHLGKGVVNLQAYDQFLTDHTPRLIKDLPTYSWDHGEYWHESRYTRAIRARPGPVHELLGHMTPDSTKYEIRWRNILQIKELPWLEGHRLQDQVVFPAAGFAVLALEAARELVSVSETQLVEILNLDIGRALTFDEDARIETLFSVTHVKRPSKGEKVLTADFKYYTSVGTHDNQLDLMASGSIRVTLGDPSKNVLLPRRPPQPNLLVVNEEDFYDSLQKMEYQYSGPFRALSRLERKRGAATGFIHAASDPKLLVHPAALDVAFQAVLLAHSAPYDGRIWAMHVPKTIRRIAFNPQLCQSRLEKGISLIPFDSVQTGNGSSSLIGDVSLFDSDLDYAMVQVEGLFCVPFSPATADEDRELFATTIWDVDTPDTRASKFPEAHADGEFELSKLLERVAFFHLQNLEREIPHGHLSRSEGPLKGLFGFATHIASLIEKGHRPFWRSEWYHDSREVITALCQPYGDKIDFLLLNAIGNSLPAIVKGEISAIEIGMKDDYLARFYAGALGIGEYPRRLGEVVRQITHRYPRMNILEIGAGTGSATRAVFEEIGLTFASYTYTDISSGFFSQAQDRFSSQALRMIYRVLDISRDPKEQGYADNSYDLVIASLVLHATPCLEQTMRNVRRLLRPGGWLVAMELTSNDIARSGTIFGAFPGWWLGAHDGRPLGPAAIGSEWDALLRKTGFSGRDTSTSTTNDGLANLAAVWATQAVDENVMFLRKPLIAASEISNYANIKDMTIIRGQSLTTAKLADDIKWIMERYCTGAIRIVESFTEVLSIPTTSTASIISLQDIDEPLFQHLTDIKFEAMKAILRESCLVLWVTEGRRARNPHSNMTAGFTRSVLSEISSLALQLLDFEERHALDAMTIARTFIRFKAMVQWQRQQTGHAKNMLMTIEPELVVLEDGTTVIPRLVPHTTMNNRYNSSRRAIFSENDINEYELALDATEGGTFSVREQFINIQGSKRPLRATHSLLSSINVADSSHFILSLCKDPEDDIQKVALSSQLSTSIYPSCTSTLLSRLEAGSESRFILLVAWKLLDIFERLGLSQGDVLLVHEPGSTLAAILENEARGHGVEIMLTSNERCRGQFDFTSTNLHTRDRISPNSIPTNIAAFLDCSVEGTGVSARSLANLPARCRKETLRCFLGTRGNAIPRPLANGVHQRLKTAVAEAYADMTTPKCVSWDATSMRLSDVQNLNYDQDKLPVIDWNPDSQLSVRIQPIDTHPLFSDSKTYWLAGLSGGLGLSLCEWMVSRGARHIVITSRNPNISGEWLEEMRTLGSIIMVYPNNLTNRKEVEDVYRKICSSMPPLAGIAQGAMILQDTSIRHMTSETMLKVTRPKVEGSINLDEVLGDTQLDFFIFFSSMSSVVGNVGQANYSAANWFMASLAEQRRQRGLAASIIHIGPILGAGYIAEAEVEARNRFLRAPGFAILSEGDLHQQFAEAIIAGRPGSNASVDIVTGLEKVSPNLDHAPAWFSNPFMSHFIRHEGVVDPVSRATGSGISLKARLEKATTRNQITTIIKDAFLPKLCALFRLDVAEIMTTDLDGLFMDEIGIDSLIAVEVRTWWIKQLNVNIPVLKILNGMSVGELITLGVDNLEPIMIPGIQAEVVIEQQGLEAESDTNPSSESIKQDILEAPEETPFSEMTNEISFDTPITRAVSVELEDVQDHRITRFENSLQLSYSQSMFWFASAFQSDKSSLNHTGLFRLSGMLRAEGIRDAVLTLGQRHDSMRTCFFLEEGRPAKAVLETSQVFLEHKPISSEDEAAVIAGQLHSHSFDMDKGETMRIVLLSLSPEVHFLLIATHSLVMDGFSGVILLRELLHLYTSQPIGQNVLQYSTYGERQIKDHTAGQFEGELSYWRSEYPTFPPALPILRVSRIVTRPTLLTYDNVRVDLRIDAQTKVSINSVCRQHRVTPFHFYLATLRAFLARYTDEEDIAIGVGDANRNSESSLESLGPYINLLPLRFHTVANQRFADILQETRSKMYSALSNSSVPFQVLLNELNVPRSATHTPIFQCFIDYRLGLSEKQVWGDLELEMCSFHASKSPYDLALDIIDNPESDCLLMFVARKDIYSEKDVELLAESYVNMIKGFASEPGTPLSTPKIHSPEAIARTMSFARGPSRKCQWPTNLVGRLDGIVQQKPEAPAIRLQDGRIMSHLVLARRSNDVAAALQGVGAIAGSRVAVLQESTFDWIASIIGIFRIGAVYVPLDVGTSRERLKAIIKDCQPTFILSDDDGINTAKDLCLPGMRAINVEFLEVATFQVPITADGNDLAMILYTSGSTGTPKGILLRHEGLSNWIEQAAEMCHLSSDEVVLQQSSPSFDMSFTQIFVALCFEGSVYLVPRCLRGDSHAIVEIISAGSITMTSATPSEYSSWLKYGLNDRLRNSSWHRALSAGEPVESGLLNLFASLDKPGLRFFNSYGPTEISLVATAMELEIKTASRSVGTDIAAGYPLPNYSVYVLDRNLQPVPVGVQGEIYVGGAGVATGYIGNPSLTAEKFVIDPFASPEYISRGWTVMHRTGDVGRWKQDGTVVIEGRISGDTQIKLRGQRIDLREVEHAIITASGGMLSEAVVSVRKERKQGQEVLVAHVKFSSKTQEKTPEEYLEALSRALHLPRYMWPAAMVVVDHLPMTSSGKLDRRVIASLPLPQSSSFEDNREFTLTNMEVRLTDIWKTLVSNEIASLHRFTPETDFFHIGGTSLLLLDLQARIRSEFGVRLALVQLFESSDLGSMAQRIRNQEVLAENFDWERETALSPSIPELTLKHTPSKNRLPSVIILTGATGFLGRAFLKALVEDPSIEKVHCIAVRNPTSHHQLHSIPKVELHEGDLTRPHFGLSEQSESRVFGKANLIIHNGADVSHLKTFQSLRQANLLATKELVEMSLGQQRCIPIHYISTGGTCTYSGLDEFSEESVSSYPPPPDAFDGYTASKWASERYLEKVHAHYDWPIWIHRPSSVMRDANASSEQMSAATTSPRLDLMQALLKYSRLLRAVPQLPNLHGVLDLVSLDTVVQSVMRGVKDTHQQRNEKRVRYVHESGTVRLDLSKLGPSIAGEGGDEIEELPPAEWAARAKGIGLHEILAAFFENLTRMRPVTYPRLANSKSEMKDEVGAKKGSIKP